MGIFGPMDKDGESRFDSRLRKQQSVLQCKNREVSGKHKKAQCLASSSSQNLEYLSESISFSASPASLSSTLMIHPCSYGLEFTCEFQKKSSQLETTKSRNSKLTISYKQAIDESNQYCLPVNQDSQRLRLSHKLKA